jgi:diguanylate cyclase (GGDEF)-like protein
MNRWNKLSRCFCGGDPRLQRLLGYWAGTFLLYLASLALLLAEVAAGTTPRGPGLALAAGLVFGVASSYVLVRFSARLGLSATVLALYQALYAIACNIAGYAMTGPIRGASLMVLLVVIVFCIFSVRPRQMAILCLVSLFSLGLTMLWMARTDPLRYPPVIEALHFAICAFSLIAVTALTGAMNKLRSRLQQQKEELLTALERIRTLATVDELTALANRRHANEVLSAEEQRLNAQPGAICIALLDLDYFKSVNDRFGHAGGDAVLRAFADAVRPELRARDLLARWGGEEFLLLLPDTGLRDAERVLARMAQRFAHADIPGLAGVTITFSAGVVARAGGERLADTIQRADKALYTAKSTGRNRIVAS